MLMPARIPSSVIRSLTLDIWLKDSVLSRTVACCSGMTLRSLTSGVLKTVCVIESKTRLFCLAASSGDAINLWIEIQLDPTKHSYTVFKLYVTFVEILR